MGIDENLLNPLFTTSTSRFLGATAEHSAFWRPGAAAGEAGAPPTSGRVYLATWRHKAAPTSNREDTPEKRKPPELTPGGRALNNLQS